MNILVRLDEDTNVRSEICTRSTGEMNTNEPRLPISKNFSEKNDRTSNFVHRDLTRVWPLTIVDSVLPHILHTHNTIHKKLIFSVMQKRVQTSTGKSFNNNRVIKTARKMTETRGRLPTQCTYIPNPLCAVVQKIELRMYSTDQMQGIKRTRLKTRSFPALNTFISSIKHVHLEH